MDGSIKPFLDEQFLLENRTAEKLFYDYGQDLPIIDYHNHLSPAEIAADKTYANLTQVWLKGDHYKWRAMRTLGISEKYISGDASDEDKFLRWAETVPFTLRNPLFHWTHLELQRYFDIRQLLNPNSAITIYRQTREQLHQPEFSTRGLLAKMKVEVVCTTDDPADDLQYHRVVMEQQTRLKMYPSFRPDKALHLEKDNYLSYLNELSVAANLTIDSFEQLLSALKKRMDYFGTLGCRAADHGLEYLYAKKYTDKDIQLIFAKRLGGKKLKKGEQEKFKSALLYHLCKMYAEKGWVQQFHLGALRNNNTRLLKKLGPDSGFDSIGDFEQARNLGKFLDRLDQENKLAKTIIYNLNPGDNELFAAMGGNFNDGSIRGKVQFGSAWWFLDQKDGMEKQLNTLSNLGLLSCFIGMVTDSRSFLSFPRHEYFRRILCNLLGKDVEKGELPHDLPWLGKIVQDICYGNVKEYFKF